MKNILTNFKFPALIGLLFVIPFMIMEAVNTQNINAIFNLPLFGFMWLLPTIFILILVPIVRNIRSGNSLMASPVSLLISVILLVLIGFVWTSLLMDQMPCFLGVPNCD